MGANTLRAILKRGIGGNTKVPALAGARGMRLKFVAHHLWDPKHKESDPEHGMPDDVADNLPRQGFLRAAGPHAPATVRRRLANWSTLTKWRGLDGAFTSPDLKLAVRQSGQLTAGSGSPTSHFA